MIRDQIAGRGVHDERVLEAIRSVPRELFVPSNLRQSAYDDTPLPLDRGQTISQPYIVGLMTELLDLRPTDRVLEIGAGSGYQTAILARLAGTVYSAEIERSLHDGIGERLEGLRVSNVLLRLGDGLTVFREFAPFDAILSAAAPSKMPEELLEQLAEGGRCIIPIGFADLQYLFLIRRVNGELVRTQLDPVRFVPMR